jgi:hypothetical protein
LKLRINKRIEVATSKCSLCKSDDLTLVRRRRQRKRALDLAFTSGGVKRTVIQCRTSVYKCNCCGNAFIPERYMRLDKHFHNLKSWAMFLHVACRISLRTVRILLIELFGIHVSIEELLTIKKLMANFYKVTYHNIIKRIISGNLVHCDETGVRLRRVGKGCVWVFANLEDVAFMYKPSREGEFLKELFKNFNGVLVSDFYAAYESIDCPQQKCLVHLMRDMNDDLLNNTFDEELQWITSAFGSLLRGIVETIDSHGLKREHLIKHEPAVADFFVLLTTRSFHSEAAAHLQGRITKNRGKLFTFIEHDGVPWNNNNAENAIKYFAYYRENNTENMSVEGLKEYLILLSVWQSCSNRGVSFLKFLLSRERDLDAFCQRKLRRRSPPLLELYPKGFVPPSLTRVRKYPTRG